MKRYLLTLCALLLAACAGGLAPPVPAYQRARAEKRPVYIWIAQSDAEDQGLTVADLQTAGVDRACVLLRPPYEFQATSTADFEARVKPLLDRLRKLLPAPYPVSMVERYYDANVNADREISMLSPEEWQKHLANVRVLSRLLAERQIDYSSDWENYQKKGSYLPWVAGWQRFPGGILDPALPKLPAKGSPAWRALYGGPFMVPTHCWVNRWPMRERGREFAQALTSSHPRVHISGCLHSGEGFYLHGFIPYLKGIADVVQPAMPTSAHSARLAFLTEDRYAAWSRPDQILAVMPAVPKAKLQAHEKKPFPDGKPARSVRHWGVNAAFGHGEYLVSFKGLPYKNIRLHGQRFIHYASVPTTPRTPAVPTFLWIYAPNGQPPLKQAAAQVGPNVRQLASDQGVK